VWSDPYDRYIYTGPGLGAYYYYDDGDNRYYPVTRLNAGDADNNSDAANDADDDSNDNSADNLENSSDDNSAKDETKQEAQDDNS
jgi:hypothetical protein